MCARAIGQEDLIHMHTASTTRLLCKAAVTGIVKQFAKDKIPFKLNKPVTFCFTDQFVTWTDIKKSFYAVFQF